MRERERDGHMHETKGYLVIVHIPKIVVIYIIYTHISNLYMIYDM